MTGLTVDENEQRALSAAFVTWARAVRETAAPDAMAGMSAAIPGSHLAWVAGQIGAVLQNQISSAEGRLARLADAAQSTNAHYTASDEIPARLFDRLGR
ncbi:hypothetical protein [Cellulomonas chengniuliangii]|uniref:ESX-1 secretion-associated protein n=1 Tax=Cellulomonas chengniuliangii TaxID=2968084 RepID=A0ABY5L005_9CELL|nr:hypothetical protein [Cellulomonas chengniuliangii]MCC2307180.1 hypothetical protein [Cellulomonas chengniuliangii]UUI76024.1 hypothetical protein NP064_03710 [Cellulomonas chengniuliangii]